MPDNPQTGTRHPSGAERRSTYVVLAAVGAIVVAQFFLVVMFAWSSSRAAPRDLPLAVSGPPATAKGLADGLKQSQPGAFTITVLPDAAAARAAVTDRQVYGAVSLSSAGAIVYTASEASPSVAQLLTQAVPAAIAHVLSGPGRGWRRSPVPAVADPVGGQGGPRRGALGACAAALWRAGPIASRAGESQLVLIGGEGAPGPVDVAGGVGQDRAARGRVAGTRSEVCRVRARERERFRRGLRPVGRAPQRPARGFRVVVLGCGLGRRHRAPGRRWVEWV